MTGVLGAKRDGSEGIQRPEVILSPSGALGRGNRETHRPRHWGQDEWELDESQHLLTQRDLSRPHADPDSPFLPTPHVPYVSTFIPHTIAPPAVVAKPPPRKKRRVHVVEDGELCVSIYGHDQRLVWAHRVGWFLGAMRGALGDRSHRLEWGGSVVDSVVGAFLTQNTSDYLSSNAFMCLAARFPSPAGRVAAKRAFIYWRSFMPYKCV
jgi:hypothetical protein